MPQTKNQSRSRWKSSHGGKAPVQASAAKWKRFTGGEGVLVLSGYGLRLGVERGHLVMEDGIAETRRVRRMSRVDRDVKRITIIGHAGTISLDAIRSLHDVKVPLLHLDTDGRVLAMVAPDGPDHPTLRRAQARAVDSEVGVTIMRDLLRQKLDGQERVLHSLTAGQLALPRMELGRRALTEAKDFIDLRGAESQAAAAYWIAWGRVPVNFLQRDQEEVPKHWRTFNQRVSALTGSPRLAVNPANALLNYIYTILEAEARLALLAVGCDPGIGIQHADYKTRDSMACDVMEAVRPDVDAWLLAYLEQRRLRRQDFVELRNGQCRLMPAIARELAATASLWATTLGPVVEGVAKALYEHATSPESPAPWNHTRARRPKSPTKRLATPLTQEHRRQATRLEPKSAERPIARPITHFQQPDIEERFGARRPGTTIPPHPFITRTLTREQFLYYVIPILGEMRPEEIAAGVGLSESYCAKIQGGRGTPHRKHWAAFAKLVFAGGYRGV